MSFSDCVVSDIRSCSFAMQAEMARCIQSRFRGFFTRKHWEVMYNRMKTIKAAYHRRIERAQKLRRAALQRHLRYRVHTWRDNASYAKRLRFFSAQAVQMLWRCYWARRRRAEIVRRRVAANRKYLVACEVHYSMQLMQHLGEWHKIFIKVRNDTRADLLKMFLRKKKSKAVLVWAAKKLGALLIIRKKFHNKITFAK